MTRQRTLKLLKLLPVVVILIASVVAGVRVYQATGGDLLLGGGDPSALVPLSESLAKGRQALRNNKPQVACSILERTVRAHPNDQELRLAYAESLMGLSRFADAYEQYDRAVALGEDRAEYRFAAGMAASQAKLLEQAEAQWIKARQLDPSNPQYPLYLAQLQRKLGRNDEARANLVVACKLDPGLAVAWGTLSAIALDENHLASALQHAEKAGALEPDNALWRILRAQILRRDNRPREALEALLSIPEAQRRTSKPVLEQVALCYGLLNQPADAARMYLEALEGNPDDADLTFEAAVWLARDNQNQRALSYARHALMLGNDRAKVLVDQLAKVE